ncbi:MAG: alpha/beta hydrolase [Fimbriiglobus sp.]
MPDWVWWTFVAISAISLCFALGIWLAYVYYRTRYLDQIVRIFEEKPFFIIPRGKPCDGAEDVVFETTHGLKLQGSYLKGRVPRKGVLLFGLEFGSNRWACLQYCEMLLDHGFDVFAYEPRNQGDSQIDPNYAPMQWVTNHDLDDMRAAMRYLKSRKDATDFGYGVFGISKGGSVGLALAAEDPSIRCVIVDGAYATYTTVLPYMRRWVSIYVRGTPAWIRKRSPDWFYGLLAKAAMRRSAKAREVELPALEPALSSVSAPVFMIHGEGDNYITSDMAKSLFARLGNSQSEFWSVPKAKHNQAVHVAGDEYIRRVVGFVESHLIPVESVTPESTPAMPERPEIVRA